MWMLPLVQQLQLVQALLLLVNNSMIIQFGQFDYGSNVQAPSKNITLPITFKKKYSVIINSIGGGGIPSPNTVNLSKFNFLLKGPWGDWPSRYGNWICIGS